MYAEERQQAIAQLVSRARAASRWPSWPSQFDVTTETVRRDLAVLDRIGPGAPGARRRRARAAPCTVLEAGVGERDQANTDAEGRASPAAAVDLLPAGRTRTSVIDAGHAPPPGSPRCSPATTGSPSSPTPSRSPPGWPACPRSSCTCCPAGSGPPPRPPSAPRPSRRCADLRADVAFIGTNGTQRRPRPVHPRPRRGRHQARHGRQRADRSSCSPTPRRSAWRRTVRFAALDERRRPRHRRRHQRRRPPTRSTAPGIEVVVA